MTERTTAVSYTHLDVYKRQGLNALIVITKGHAFAGGWLVPETFPDPAIDDVSLLTKRTAEGIYDITLRCV